MRRVLRLALLALVALAAVATDAGVAQEEERERYEIDMVLRVKDVDTNAHPKYQFDEFRADGSPFGASDVTTRTKRSERGSDRQHPRFEIESEAGWVKGELIVDRRYLKTTRTYQRIAYDGEGAIADGGPARTRYGGAYGRIDSFRGTLTCRASGRCTGSIRMRGSVRLKARR